MKHIASVLTKELTHTPMPDHVRAHLDGAPCPHCTAGVVYQPEVKTGFPLYLRHAVLHRAGAIVWCTCPMGQNLKTYAVRTIARMAEATYTLDEIGNIKSARGEYVSKEETRSLLDQLEPTVHAEQLLLQEPEPEPEPAPEPQPEPPPDTEPVFYDPEPEEDDDMIPALAGEWWDN